MTQEDKGIKSPDGRPVEWRNINDATTTGGVGTYIGDSPLLGPVRRVWPYEDDEDKKKSGG